MEKIQTTSHQSYREAAQVLGRAFVNDPVSRACYHGFSPGGLERALTVDFLAELKVCMRRGYPIHVNENGKIAAAAVIYPPGAYPLPVLDQWKILIKSIVGNGFYDVRTWLAWVDEVNRYHPIEAHYYLEYIGVDPYYQGRGLGSMILDHLTTKADNDGAGCYLENANPRNLPFYQRAGFEVAREMNIIGIRTWLMWRKPAPV